MVTETTKVVGTDVFYDLALTPNDPDDGVADLITIRQGQAKLYFNKETFATAINTSLSATDVVIKIYASAATLLASSSLAMTLALF